MNKIEFTPRFDFSEIIGRKIIISTSVGPNGEAVVLAVEKEFEKDPFGRNKQKFGSFPLSKPQRSYPAVFVRCDGKSIRQNELADVEIAYPFIQPLPDGEILIVAGRCDFRNGNPEQNALVYGPDGLLRLQFVLGDGINGVQTTSDGKIWVGYSDEGVFGNFGWDKPMRAAGLVCFDKYGKKVWDYEPPKGVGSIADCYAFNVCIDAVWTCYYTDFPLVRIDSHKRICMWKNDVDGANAVAIHGDRILFWGGYGDQRSRCILQKIKGCELVLSSELTITSRSKLCIDGASIIGRGSLLHAFSDRTWFTFDLAEVSESAD